MISEHKEKCLFYGFLDTCLSNAELKAISDAGLKYDDAYGIECDLQCKAFDTFTEALEYYKTRLLET